MPHIRGFRSDLRCTGLPDSYHRSFPQRYVLFLADRNNLVSNALKPFSKYIEGGVSDISAENPDRDTGARICLCTYNSMLNFLNKPKKEFSVGHFDLIFVDEAHRSLFNVYRAIFEYFDSFVIGLTATPSKAIDRSTYEILDLNTDEPTFEVKFEEAVNLNYLVSYRAFDKTSAVMKNGLKYNDLSEAEKEQYEEMFADENGNIPEEVAGKAFYRDIFNNDTIDKMFADLFANGLRVENGNKIGKTLIFAVDHNHAVKIAERFKKKYPHLGDEFCQVIDNQIKKNKTRQDNFAKKDSNPQIVVSVDMMDTGVDIPEIVNLVFFKRVLSRIKFDQMWGRGTRTCKDLHVITPPRDYFEGRTLDDERKDYVDKQGFFVFDTVACAASGVGLRAEAARTEHQLVGCVTELRAKGIAFDSNDLVLDGIFPRYRSAVRSRKLRICADLLIGFFGFFDNFLRCGSDTLTEHLGNLSKIIADKSLRVAFKNNYVLDIAAEIPFILGGFLVFTNGDFLVSDIHGVKNGVITDHSFVVHTVLLILLRLWFFQRICGNDPHREQAPTFCHFQNRSVRCRALLPRRHDKRQYQADSLRRVQFP